MSTGGKGGTNINPRETISAQSQANEATALMQAQLNMMNQNTPAGSVTYNPVEGGRTQEISRPWGVDNFRLTEEPVEFESNVTLSPQQQRLWDLQENVGIGLGELGERQLGQIGTELESPLDFSGLGDVPGMGQQGRSALEDALFSRIEPSITRDREALEARLVNQGHARGSEGFRGAFKDFEQGVGDTRTSVAIQAGAEQSRQLQARQQAIQEMLTRRSVPINEITALTQGGQVTLPTQVGAQGPQTGIAPTDVTGAYAMQQQAAAQRAQQQQGLYGGMMGLGGMLGAAGIMSGGRG
jgi:hypothetical protein